MKMKLILVLVIVFSLDILKMLAETKLPQNEEKDSPAMNDDVSRINDAALTKRAIGKHCSGMCKVSMCLIVLKGLRSTLHFDPREGLPDIRY